MRDIIGSNNYVPNPQTVDLMRPAVEEPAADEELAAFELLEAM
jgi:hypothetical protein